jgi:prophage regulatory protein
MFNDARGGINMATAILRLPAVKARTGLSRSTIYLRVSEGRFPKPISLGGRAVGWVETEVDNWLQQQIETSRQAAALSNGGASDD